MVAQILLSDRVNVVVRARRHGGSPMLVGRIFDERAYVGIPPRR